MGWAGLIAVKVAREGCDRLSGRQPGKPGGGGRGWVVGSWQSALLFSQRDRVHPASVYKRIKVRV
jgi:hypothetical protein